MATTRRKETLRPVADATSSLVIPHAADSASFGIRLIDTQSMKLISCELGQAPAYVAISHVWADKLFPVAQKHDVDNAVGFRMAIAALKELSPQTHHIWVDTWCIDQADNIDKDRQIRSMGEIYRTADFVLVTLNHNLDQTQSDLDDIMSKLGNAAGMLEIGDVWRTESLEYLESAEVVEPLLQGFALLRSLMQSSWPTRIWCFQEAALARKILWIGLDRVPLHMSDMTLSAIVNIPSLNPQLKLKLGSYYQSSSSLMQPLLYHRLGWDDPTCVMEAAYLRNSTIREDEIYGLMGASGVIIEPDPTKGLEMLWNKWWEKAISLGHIRWLMLSWYSGYPHLDGDLQYARFGCVVPPFRQRSRASTLSNLRNCRSYSTVSVGEDCVKVPGYCVGTCSSFVHLGSAFKISDYQSSFMTVACLGRGDLNLTMRIVTAIWMTNVSESNIKSISKILCSKYHSNSAKIENGLDMRQLYQGRGREEHDLIEDLSRECYHYLHSAFQFELYLTTVESRTMKTEIIMHTSEPITPGNFRALDLNATVNPLKMEDPEKRHYELRVLMLAQTVPEATIDTQAASSKPSPYLHKAGITLPVRFAKTAKRARALRAHTWDDSPLEDFNFPLSAASCPGCQVQAKNVPEIHKWLRSFHEKGVEKIFRKDIHVEYQRRFGRGQVEFLSDVKDRSIIDMVLYRNSGGGYSWWKDEVLEEGSMLSQ